MSHSFLFSAIVFLSASVIAVPLTKRWGLGSVLGYLAAGIIIGPYGFRLFQTSEETLHFAELGIVLLLFLIGLELNPKKLWQLRKAVFGCGSVQLSLCSLLVLGAALLFGASLKMALIGAIAFSMSSTAIVLQILKEKAALKSELGETSFAILLFQDLAVIPMLALLPFASGNLGSSEASTGIIILKSISAIAGLILAGRFILRPIFRYIARTDLREIFTAFSLLLVIGIAALMQSVGLSMALGSFLAGVLLADSEYRHELEIDIEPFKGLLLGLFFISVGIGINFSILAEDPLKIIGLISAFVMAKALGLFYVAKKRKLSFSDSIRFSILLSQGGEFAFVLFNLATGLMLLTGRESELLTLVVACSMLTTPFLMMIFEKWIENRFNKVAPVRDPDSFEGESNPVIIAGYGRFGQIVARILIARNIGATVMDRDPNQVDMIRRFGMNALYGDITRLDLLQAAGAATAKILVIAIDDAEATRQTVEICQQYFKNLKLLVRVANRPDAFHLINKKVPVYRELFGTSLEVAEQVLKDLGYSHYDAHDIVEKFRKHDIEMMHKAAKHADDEQTLISLSKVSREELMKLMADDQQRKEAV